ncbi:MAG TPA: alkaline phosphatase D family protein, partial [Thermopolyspora sp.]
SLLRPVAEARRVLFGSCRTSVPHDATHTLSHGVDVLRAYGDILMDTPGEEWPDLLLLLGDQVYADEPSAEMLEFIRARRGREPQDEVADFEDYAELYRQAWTEPRIRWLLSTLPSAMIFDDHDVRDDWNTSATWRARMAEVPWWHRRVVSALGAYYIYQHLGNLSPDERARDPLFARIRKGTGDMGAVLDEFAARADADPGAAHWSYARDIGGVRLIMLDTRSSRVLAPRGRRMLHEREWAWFERLATGGVDHLVIGSSIPIMLPPGIHHVESWNEALADGVWGRRAARWAERLRQAIDLEHWAAFRRSFEDMARVLTEIAVGARGTPPATILLLSGDVHYSYLARTPGHQIHQLVCSPIRNPLSRTLRLANVAASLGPAGLVGAALARLAGLPRRPLRWKITNGPWFRNAVATLDLGPRAATVSWHTAGVTAPGEVSRFAEARLEGA